MDLEALADAVRKAGYEVASRDVELTIEGMTCASCVGRVERALGKVKQCLRDGSHVPGFGHPLYPNGDPRAAPLIAAAEALNGDSPRVRTLAALRDAMDLAGGERATIDHALVVVSAALELPAGSASAIFAVGRSIGYMAHALEQRESGQLLRPRARYVGP